MVASDSSDGDTSRPYPFYLASPLEDPIHQLGERADWLAEWKWDGIRGQLIRRAGNAWLWSRGEELISQLQRRIGRQKLTAKVLAEAPAAFVAYDLLEHQGQDIRGLPLRERRARLEALLAAEHFASLRAVVVDEWHELLGSKRGTQVELALARLRRFAPGLRTWALSATLSNLEQAARAAVGTRLTPTLVGTELERPVVVDTLLPDTVDAFPWAGHLGLAMVEPGAARTAWSTQVHPADPGQLLPPPL